MIEGLSERGFNILPTSKDTLPPDEVVDVFARASGEYIGEQPLFEAFKVERSHDHPGVRVHVGVEANKAWFDMQPLPEVGVDEALLPSTDRGWAHWPEEVASGIDFPLVVD